MAKNIPMLPLTGGGPPKSNSKGGAIVNRARLTERDDLDDSLDYIGSAKHRLARDYGYPTLLNGRMLQDLYDRTPLAKAAVSHILLAAFQDNPDIRRTEDEPDAQEKALAFTLERVGFWREFREAYRRSLIHGKAALLLRVEDGLPLDQPAERIRGIERFVEAIPIWGDDLSVIQRGTDETDIGTYQRPVMYQVEIEDEEGQALKSQRVHASRLLIVSRDGTLKCASELAAAYNSLTDAEKVRGAMAEAGWKNARMAFVMDLDKDSELEAIGGTEEGQQDEIDPHKAMDGMIGRFNSKADNAMLTQGIKTQVLNTAVGDLESANKVATEHICAAFTIPRRILVGGETGERSATEDAKLWARSCEARRENTLRPIIRQLIDRLIGWGALEASTEWRIDWTSLLEMTTEERSARVKDMNNANRVAWVAGRRVAFTTSEIREAEGLEPLTDEQIAEEIDRMNPEGLDDLPTGDMPPDEGGGGNGNPNDGGRNG